MRSPKVRLRIRFRLNVGRYRDADPVDLNRCTETAGVSSNHIETPGEIQDLHKMDRVLVIGFKGSKGKADWTFRA